MSELSHRPDEQPALPQTERDDRYRRAVEALKPYGAEALRRAVRRIVEGRNNPPQIIDGDTGEDQHEEL